MYYVQCKLIFHINFSQVFCLYFELHIALLKEVSVNLTDNVLVEN